MTFIVPEGSLAIQRHVNALSLPHIALLLLKRRVSREGGMSTETFIDESEADAIRCRLVPAAAGEQERLIADRIASVNKFICSFDVGTELPLSARLKVSGISAGATWSIILELTAKLTPAENAMAVLSSYLCEPVKAPAPAET